MKKLKLFYRTLNLLIVLELFLAPIALANDAASAASQKESWWNKSTEFIGNFTTALNSTVKGFLNGNRTGVDKYKASLQPGLQVTPVDPSQLPGVFQGCVVLPARPNALSDSMKCSQTDQNDIREGYAAALIEIAEENRNDLRNFQTKAHEPKTAQGLSCYAEAIKDANSQLLAREEQVRLYQQNLKKLLENFNLTADPLLETVKSNGALLDGGTNFDKYHKDGKFSDLFLGAKDPKNSCGSMITATSLQKLGKDGGIRGIQDHMFKKLTETPKNSGGSKNLSAQKLLQTSHQIEKEIDSIANKLSSSMTSNNSSKANFNDISYNGRLLKKDNEAMKKVLGNFNADFDRKKKSILNHYNIAEITNGNKDVQSLLARATADNNPMDYSSLVDSLNDYERQQKDDCLKDDFIKSLGGVERFSKKFRDRNSRIKGKDNALATLIERTINSGKPIDKMIEIISNAENKEKYKNYVYSPNKSLVLDEKRTIKASTAMRASGYLEIFKEQCDTMWNAKDSRNSAGFSKFQAVNEVKKVAMEMTNHRKVAASTLNSQLKKELKTCSSDTSTGVASNSCESALDMNSSNFCLRTAKTCATNTQDCYSTLNKAFTEIKGEQVQAKNIYNSEVTKLKKSLKNELRGLNNELIRQSRVIDAQLDLGGVFTAPESTFDESKKIYLSEKDKEIDQSLRMEDPAAYIDALIKDSKAMEKAMADQRKKYFGANGKGGEVNQIAKGYVASYKANEKIWDGIIADCNNTIDGITESDNKRQEAINEQNKNLNKHCGTLQAFNMNPDSVDHEELAKDLGSVIQLVAASPAEAQALASDKAAIARIRAYDAKCEVEEDGLPIAKSEKSNDTLSAKGFCADSNAVNLYDDAEKYCTKLSDLKKKAKNPCTVDEFKQMVTNLDLCFQNGKIKSASNGCKTYKTEDTIDGKKVEVEVPAIAIDSSNALKYSAKLLRDHKASLCSPIQGEIEKLEKITKNFATAYNCKRQREKAGGQDFSISKCNSVAEDNVGKDMYADLFNQMGGAIGTSMGLSNN